MLGVCAGRALGTAPWGWEEMRMRKRVWNQPLFLSLVFCGTGAIWKCGMLCLEEEEKEEEGCSHCPAGTGFLSSAAFPASDFLWDELSVAPQG